MMYRYFIILGLIFSAVACMPESQYEKVKERELASGKIHNDLFLDLHFEMARKDFFSICWDHNKKGILTNGAHHLTVLYKPQMPSGKAAEMYFYPKFEDDKLFFMPIEFIYPSWFPGNEAYSNETLYKDVATLLESWYGKDFFEVTNKDKTISAKVKIDGNRLIRIFKKDISTVRVEILDLRVKDITEISKGNEAA
jgi:hypothetical protein